MKQKVVVLGMFLIAVLLLMPISTMAQQSMRTPTSTPEADAPFLLENVPNSHGRDRSISESAPHRTHFRHHN